MKAHSVRLLSLFGIVLFGILTIGVIRADAANPTKVVFFLLDGCRYDFLNRLMGDGKLPTFAQMKREGTWVDTATSVYPSTTGPAYTPFVNGLLPSNSGIVGIRWYERTKGILRNYCGTDFLKYNEDLNPDFPTIYELLPKGESLSVVGIVDRGASKALVPIKVGMLNLIGQSLAADQAVFKAFMGEVERKLPRYSFVSFHSFDVIGHQNIHAPEMTQAFLQMDSFMKQFLQKCREKEELENLTIIISADHGMSPVSPNPPRKKTELADLLSQRLHLNVQSPSLDMIGNSFSFNSKREKMARESDVIICPNGNACMMLYLKGRVREEDEGSFKIRPSIAQLRAYRRTADKKVVGDVIKELLGEPSVGLLMARDGRDKVRIFSSTGEGLIDKRDGKIGYSVVFGKDPLQMDTRGRRNSTGKGLSDRDWLELTCQDQFYPDSVFQIAQLMEAENSGDIIINAAVGYDPSPQGQKGLHGGLDRCQMRVPLMCWGNGIPAKVIPCARTVDVFPTVLKALGLKAPMGIPGIPLF